MAQLLLKTGPKHRDLPIIAAASLGDRDRSAMAAVLCCASLSHWVFWVRTSELFLLFLP